MRHPSESDLSLFAGGDLGVLERWSVARHTRRCSTCGASIRIFKASREVLNSGLNDLPPGLNWNRLATEMTGNIRVGLAAGECVNGVAAARNTRGAWQAAAFVCSATLLLFVAWILNVPRKPIHDAGIALQKTELGIQLTEGGGAITLMHTRASSPVISSSSPGQLRSRYVDDETNQVTINNVYAQ
jgi:hypothetical protein